ncbi:hypothetical protein GQR58_026878 [Nymphon striatum]|nr:hypothetical protein GQR58_026878 [Nymphon striatum]
MSAVCIVVGRNYLNRLRNVCCVQGFLCIQREFQFLFVCPRAPKFFEGRVGMLGKFCRCVYSALLSAEIIPIDEETCVVFKVFLAVNGNVHHSHNLQNGDIFKNIDSKFQHKSSLIQKELYSTLLEYSALFLDIPTQTSEISCDRVVNIQEDSDIFKNIEIKSSFEETIFSGTKLCLCDSNLNYKNLLLLLKYIPAEFVKLPDLTCCILFTFIFELFVLSTRHVKKVWTKQMCVVAKILSINCVHYQFILSTECILLLS